MRPTQHPSSNAVLSPPAGMTNEQCRPLSITRIQWEGGMPGVVSFWEPSAEDIALINAGKLVRISFVGTHTHPPVAIGVDGDGLLDLAP